MIYISLAISIIGSVLAVTSFFTGRKDKSNDEVSKMQYNQGKTDQILKNIMDKLDKIEAKLDSYDNEIDSRIDKAIETHIKEYHKGEK